MTPPISSHMHLIYFHQLIHLWLCHFLTIYTWLIVTTWYICNPAIFRTYTLYVLSPLDLFVTLRFSGVYTWFIFIIWFICDSAIFRSYTLYVLSRLGFICDSAIFWCIHLIYFYHLIYLWLCHFVVILPWFIFTTWYICHFLVIYICLFFFTT